MLSGTAGWTSERSDGAGSEICRSVKLTWVLSTGESSSANHSFNPDGSLVIVVNVMYLVLRKKRGGKLNVS